MTIRESLIDNIKCFILQSNTVSQSTAAYINYYQGLNVYTSFGFGNTAKVTWISFTGYGQTTSDGIYPVLLYYRLRNKIILSYGISATNIPSLKWPTEIEAKTIGDYFKENGNLKGGDINKYKESLVYQVFDVNSIDYDKLINSIDFLISFYKDCLEQEGLPRETEYSETGARWRSIKNTTFDFSKIEEKANISMADIRNNNSIVSSNNFSIQRLIDLISNTGLQYSPVLVKRFAFSLMAKPFVILSGLAGSGKTQLALAFAKAMARDDSQICTASVGADWTNREPLLGYPNALDCKKYIRPESGVLDLLIEANKPANGNNPYFLILDEMNMSYVERYFADFLSAMESHEAIQLWAGSDQDSVPASIRLPKNVFIIGTINVDETTYMFSPKVLDRANVIEFKISADEMDEFLGNIRSIDRNSLNGKAAGMGESFINKSLKADIAPDEAIKSTLLDFFKQLKSVNAEFGYRSATEIFKFIDIARNCDDSASALNDNEILDAALVQKLLPKLHGSRKKLVPVLKTLWSFCGAGCSIDDASEVATGTTFPLTADKVLRMYRSAIDNGFTSYSEA